MVKNSEDCALAASLRQIGHVDAVAACETASLWESVRSFVEKEGFVTLEVLMTSATQLAHNGLRADGQATSIGWVLLQEAHFDSVLHLSFE